MEGKGGCCRGRSRDGWKAETEARIDERREMEGPSSVAYYKGSYPGAGSGGNGLHSQHHVTRH